MNNKKNGLMALTSSLLLAGASASDDITINEPVTFKENNSTRLTVKDNEVKVSDNTTLVAKKTNLGLKVHNGVWGEWRVEHHDHHDGDRTTKTMVSTNKSMCFLTRVGVREVETNDKAECYIGAANGSWTLTAYVNRKGYAVSAYCGARCVTWNWE